MTAEVEQMAAVVFVVWEKPEQWRHSLLEETEKKAAAARQCLPFAQPSTAVVLVARGKKVETEGPKAFVGVAQETVQKTIPAEL